MRKSTLALLALVLLATGALWPKLAPDSTTRGPATTTTAALPDFLPAQALETIRLIQRGGPYPHRQDGSVFGNREGHLPQRQRGHYREYTVATPGLAHRGARRIVTGGDPPVDWYYTDDHYESFRPFRPAPAEAGR